MQPAGTRKRSGGIAHDRQIRPGGRVLELYRDLALRHFGDDLERIVLFGSRARGTAHKDSDWDVAVFLKYAITAEDQRRVSAIGHDVMCETGALIQSIALPATRWDDTDELARRIRGEGVAIYG